MKRSGGGLFLLGSGAVILLLFGAIGVKFLASASGDGASFQRPPTPVATEPVRLHSFVDRIAVVGSARAAESITVTATVTEIVRGLRFESGEAIEAGAILAELTSGEETADLRDAEAGAVEAEAQYKRQLDLVERGVASQSTLDEALAERDQARAQISSIEARLQDRLVRAPFAGMVGLRLVSPGALVRPGDAIATLDDISAIKLDFAVPERFIALVAPGVPIIAESAAYAGERFEGRVDSVDTRIEPSTRSFIARAELPNPEGALRPGMLLTVTILVRERDSFAVPELSVLAAGDTTYVYVLSQSEDGTPAAERREVDLGVRDDGVIEILSGLALGDVVVAEGVHRVRPGMPLRLVDEADAAEPENAS